VYLRDIGQATGMVTSLLMFSRPSSSVRALPEDWQAWLWLNPLALIIESAQCAADGQWPDWGRWVCTRWWAAFAVLGARWSAPPPWLCRRAVRIAMDSPALFIEASHLCKRYTLFEQPSDRLNRWCWGLARWAGRWLEPAPAVP
jgi:hypothetical protein